MSNFYRDRFRLVVRWLFFMIVLNVILAGTVFYLYTILPKAPSKFYASNMHSGNVTLLHPLSSPMLETPKLLNWSSQLVNQLFSFNFVNYRDNFTDLRQNFTDDGWKAFNNEMQRIGIVDNVINKKLFVTATLGGKTQVLNDGVRNGLFAWTVRVPIQLSYRQNNQDSNPISQQRLTVDMVIVRVPNLDNNRAIAISDISIA